MQILFVHQNFPGQYRHLVRHFASDPRWQTYAIGEKSQVKKHVGSLPENITLLGYESPRELSGTDGGLGVEFANQNFRADAIGSVLQRQKQQGLQPDIICAHPGWGEGLFLRELFPHAKLLYYFEFFFDPTGPLINFDPEFPWSFGQRVGARIKNATTFLSLHMADAVVCPTKWQWQTFPKEYQKDFYVIHDGVDTQAIQPNPNAKLPLVTASNAEKIFTKKDEIISFAVRNLEPSRGFHRFMRSLPALQMARPKAWIVIVGGDQTSYLTGPTSGKSWREVLLAEVGDQLDLSRILFTGRLPYPQLLDLFAITSLHIYLTIPFVLSWSMLEAMACGAPLLASKTGPVEEVISDGENGALFDFFDGEGLVTKAVAMLENPVERNRLAENGRKTIVEKYDLHSQCLPQLVSLIDGLVDA